MSTIEMAWMFVRTDPTTGREMVVAVDFANGTVQPAIALDAERRDALELAIKRQPQLGAVKLVCLRRVEERVIALSPADVEVISSKCN